MMKLMLPLTLLALTFGGMTQKLNLPTDFELGGVIDSNSKSDVWNAQIQYGPLKTKIPQSSVSHDFPQSKRNLKINLDQLDSVSHDRQIVINQALSFVDKQVPYVWGGASLSGMDCSGLTMLAYAAIGKALPHYTVWQEQCSQRIPVNQAQPGDLLFWGAPMASYHVALYLGNQKYVQAPQPGHNVEITTLNHGFYPSFAGRIL
ncbi:C40 family peptidase [Ligilactobacillus equi]